MTFATLQKIIADNDIPDDVHLMSDSGWECSATDMDGVYYNKRENTIVFTQEEQPDYDYYTLAGEWELICPKREVAV